MAPLLPGFTVEVLPSIDSTNTELMRRARAGRPSPRCWWPSSKPPARPPGPRVAERCGLPLAVAGPAHGAQGLVGPVAGRGVSVAESLQPTLPPLEPGQPPRIGLKWPNDLWLSGDRKLGGILVEPPALWRPRPRSQPPPRHRRPLRGGGHWHQCAARSGEGMSMPRLPAGRGAGPGRPRRPAAHRAPLVAMLQGFEACGFAPVQPRFAARDVLQGRPVTLSDGQTGTAHGVGEDGALLVHTAQGMQAVTSAEISVRPAVLSTL